MSGIACKSWNSFNLTQLLKNVMLMFETLQKTQDASAAVIHIHLVLVYIKNNGKVAHCNGKMHWV